MVAGGTGITPMLQIARASLRDDGDATKFALLYANRTPGDILLRAELDALAAAHPDRFSVRYVVDESDGRADVDAVGRVDAAQVARFLPPASAPRTLVLVCGPKGFVAHLCGARARPGGPVGGLLGALGYDRVVPFG
jgi:NAD(P)H-flavin reductase